MHQDLSGLADGILSYEWSATAARTFAIQYAYMDMTEKSTLP